MSNGNIDSFGGNFERKCRKKAWIMLYVSPLLSNFSEFSDLFFLSKKCYFFYGHHLSSRVGLHFQLRRFFGFSSSYKFIWITLLQNMAPSGMVWEWGRNMCSQLSQQHSSVYHYSFPPSNTNWILLCIIYTRFHKGGWRRAGCHHRVLGGLDCICICKV